MVKKIFVLMMFMVFCLFCTTGVTMAAETDPTTTVSPQQDPAPLNLPAEVPPPVVTPRIPTTDWSYAAVRFGYAPTYGGVKKFKVDYTHGGDSESYTVENAEGKNYDMLFTFKESKEQNGLYWDMGFSVFTGKFNEITFENENITVTDTDVSVSGFNFIFGAGYAFQFVPWYTLELGGRGGIGIASATFDFPYLGEYSGTTGTCALYEIGARNIFSYKKLEFGIEVGYMGSVALVSFEEPTSEGYYIKDNDATFNSEGLMLKTFLGFKF